MEEKDLFYYMVENNEKKYNETLELIKEKENIEENATDEQKVFLRDFYMRLLFRIAVLEYKGYSDTNIADMLNLNSNVEIFDIEKIQEIKGKYRNILDEFYNDLEEMYKNVTVNEEIEVKKKTKLNKVLDYINKNK